MGLIDEKSQGSKIYFLSMRSVALKLIFVLCIYGPEPYFWRQSFQPLIFGCKYLSWELFTQEL
jgi:hypothetical protein